jgi:hypothetical protein
MFSANVDHDGDRYGFIRNLKSAQDEINMRRSKALHLLNSRRVISRRARLTISRLPGGNGPSRTAGSKKPRPEMEPDDAAKIKLTSRASLRCFRRPRPRSRTSGLTRLDRAGP